jgi:selenoprotein W-related protein
MPRPAIEIVYRRLCGWGLRAGWKARDGDVCAGSGLRDPHSGCDGGVFEIRLEGETIWSRKERGRFPQMRQIKQSVRDRIVPGRSLGHTDAP